MRAHGWIYLLAASTIAALACSDTATPVIAPELKATNPGPAGTPGSAKGWASARIAEEVPAFGGAFVDDDGTMTIYVTDRRAEGAARQAMQRILARRGEGSRPIRVLTAKHTLDALRGWHARLRQLSGVSGVIGGYVDERKNLVRLAVESESVRAQVVAMLPQIGVTADLVDFEISTRDTDAATLNDRVRGLASGMKITRPAASNETCSMGMYVTYNNAKYAVTASHCTQDPGKGGNQDANFYQPGSPFNSTNYIGDEEHDPSYTSTFPGCPVGYRCRNSDAALIRIPPALVTYPGHIARTVQRVAYPTAAGSLTIDAANPYIRVEGVADVVMGDIVEKVGQRTGWTAGPVTFTCQPYEQIISGVKYLTMCTGQANFGNGPGDSGGPVFYRNSSGAYYLVGIYYAGNGTSTTAGRRAEFSHWSGVEQDLGTSANDLELLYSPIEAFVQGPNSVAADSTYTWGAGIASGGSGLYAYSWEYHDGTSWHSLGNGLGVTRSITSSDPDFTLRVIVTSPGWIGGSDTSTVLVDNVSWAPPPPPFSGYIEGSYQIRGDQDCSWRALVTGGTPPYRYTWYWNSAVVGTAQTYTRFFDADASNDGDEIGHLELLIWDATDTIYYPDGLNIYRDDANSSC